MGTDTMPGIPDMVTDTMSGVPIGNVQRPTPNSQLSMGVTERKHGGRKVGTDTGFGRSNVWPGGPDQAPAGRTMLPGHPDMGTGTISWGQTQCRVYPIW